MDLGALYYDGKITAEEYFQLILLEALLALTTPTP